MKTEFEHNNKIIATADLEEPLYEDSTIVIFGKEYVVFENYHDVEIDENGVHEKMICTVVTEKERDDWNLQVEFNKLQEDMIHGTK